MLVSMLLVRPRIVVAKHDTDRALRRDEHVAQVGRDWHRVLLSLGTSDPCKLEIRHLLDVILDDDFI
ncbi:hypothetical protein D3C80_1532980 [compost metagenome]